MMQIKKICSLLCAVASVFTATTVMAQEKLIFAIDLIRHGDRSPVVDIPNSTYHWPQALGELSPQGMQQEYQNGVRFRKEYIQSTHLLPEHYQSDTFYVRSTDFNRTLMSAQSVLQGLYPLGTGPHLVGSDKPALPGGYQPIPIHTMPKSQEDLLMPDISHEHYLALKKKYVFSRADWQEKNTKYQSDIKKWNAILGLQLHNIDEAVELGDYFKIAKINNVPLPKGISSEEAQKITALADWSFVSIFTPRQMGVATSHNLITTVAHYLSEASEKKSALKYVLFSSHDSTLMAVLSALQVPVTSWPHYASDVKFLLFEDNQQYKVKVTFNDQPMVLPGCGNSKTCTLQQFVQVAKQIEEEAPAYNAV